MKLINLKKCFGFGVIIIFLMIPFLMPDLVLGQQPQIPDSTYEFGTGESGNNPAGSGNVGNNPAGSGNVGFTNPIKANNLATLVYMLVKAIISIGWVVVVFALIYSGFRFVVASGKPEEITKAKKSFMWTVIGGMILLGSLTISEVICNTANQFVTDKIECQIKIN